MGIAESITLPKFSRKLETIAAVVCPVPSVSIWGWMMAHWIRK